jgi:tetraacyldisaccharide 4'-kinase
MDKQPRSTRWLDILSGRNRSLSAAIWRAVTGLGEPLYRAVTTGRNLAYDQGWATIHRAALPVISVGNLTTGGTGKTPFVILLVELLQELGRQPAVLMRGYKATADGPGDEAMLLGQRLPGVPIVVNPDRRTAAHMATYQHASVDMLVLDDGFQHRRLHREVDLVLIDASEPFGFGHVLPRGLMREAPTALRRADGVIITRANAVDRGELTRLDRAIERWHGHPPLGHAVHRWGELIDHADRVVDENGQPVFVFCGIGNPRAFFEQAEQQCHVVGRQALADHHHYTAPDLAALTEAARAAGAAALLTTEKDWVKLRPLVESQPAASLLPIWRAPVRMQLREGTGRLTELLRDRLGLQLP